MKHVSQVVVIMICVVGLPIIVFSIYPPAQYDIFLPVSDASLSCENRVPSHTAARSAAGFPPPPWANQPGDPLVAICAIIKEEPDIREFVYHHVRHFNISNIYIYDHGSNPSVEELLSDYIAVGRVEVIPWQDGVEERVLRNQAGKTATNPQLEAYMACADRLQAPPMKHSWVALFDGDEYLWLNSTWMARGGLGAFLNEFDDAGAVGVNWVFHGSSGRLDRPLEGVRQSYFSCFPDGQHHIKTILHLPYGGIALSPHQMELLEGKKYFIETHEEVRNGPFSTSYSVQNISLHHYVLKSQEDFKKKASKGAGDSTRKDWNFFHSYDLLAIELCEPFKDWE